MNTNRNLFLASFFTLIAAGMLFGIRGTILGDWATQFAFTKNDLGVITGFGLTGFGITIIACSLVADRIGYKPLMVLAFLLHISSAVVTMLAAPAAGIFGTNRAAFWALCVGSFMFSLANGVCESVINPLVATLYPHQKTHYLNILHAGWPGGLVAGTILAYLFCGRDATIVHVPWELAVAFFLPPVLYYGFVTLKEKFPISEARAAGVSFGAMLAEFASPLLLFLFLLHAMVGYVELGTDSWITNIQESVIHDKARLLFIWTSGIMFILRFFAGPIVERINPIGLLFISAVLGCIGLFWLGSTTAGLAIFLAATVYGVGKTFLWPTMLGVVGERFPKGGALTMGTIGGIGMLSAGLLGGPGIGYKQDYYASQRLQETDPAAYERYRADKAEGFLFLPKIAGLDGAKVGELKDKINEQKPLTTVEQQDKGPVLEAEIYGGRMALKWTAAVPAAMAVGYLILVLYFRAQGGYKVEVLHGQKPEGEHYTGGVEGPVEA
ncbi:MAG: MFS transporter [Planctomycetaceae bacterium]